MAKNSLKKNKIMDPDSKLDHQKKSNLILGNFPPLLKISFFCLSHFMQHKRY